MAPARTFSRADGAESADSNTAPSTVWDELDDIKSRIKKLELTGKLPSTSGAAISNGSGDRPRTATTTQTTISSSPRHQKTSGSPSIQIGGPGGPDVHPLLHTALANCKAVLDIGTYQALETAASDALELAVMTGGANQQANMYSGASVVNGGILTDRQVRRKADSVCRSLTELCISLCDNAEGRAPGTQTSLADKRRSFGGISAYAESSVEPPSRPYARQNSLEPETAAEVARAMAPSRALNRIEARRASLYALGSGSNSPREGTPRESPPGRTGPKAESPSLLQPKLASIQRSGTSLLRTRRRADEGDDEPSPRPLSRAMTEVSQIRAANRGQRVSREYTSNVPLPEPSVSSHLSHPTSLPLRRQPATAVLNESGSKLPSRSISLRRESGRGFLDRSPSTPAGAKSSDSPTVGSSERRQRITSLGPHYSASGSSGAANSGLSRTGSLGRQRARHSINVTAQ